MSVIDTLEEMDIKIDWTTLRLAWEGLFGKRLVSMEEICRVAEEKLEVCASGELPWVAELATARDEETVTEGLAALGSDAKHSLAFWKLVCALLSERLSTLPQDPIGGPAELSEFWSELGPPPGHPHVFQGVDNDLTPAEYYTATNLENLVASQRQWLAEKIEEVKREERV